MTRDWHATYLDDRVTMAAAHRHVATTGEDGWAAAAQLAHHIEPGLGNWDAVGAAAVLAPGKAERDENRWNDQLPTYGYDDTEDYARTRRPPTEPERIGRPQYATYAQYAAAHPERRPASQVEWIGTEPGEGMQSVNQNAGTMQEQPGRCYRPGDQRPVQTYHVTASDMGRALAGFFHRWNGGMDELLARTWEWTAAGEQLRGFEQALIVHDECAEVFGPPAAPDPVAERSQLEAVLIAARKQTRLDELPADLCGCAGMSEARGRRLVTEDPPGTRQRRFRLTALGRLEHRKLFGRKS